jgi:hypothetical protein
MGYHKAAHDETANFESDSNSSVYWRLQSNCSPSDRFKPYNVAYLHWMGLFLTFTTSINLQRSKTKHFETVACEQLLCKRQDNNQHEKQISNLIQIRVCTTIILRKWLLHLWPSKMISSNFYENGAKNQSDQYEQPENWHCIFDLPKWFLLFYENDDSDSGVDAIFSSHNEQAEKWVAIEY